MQIIIYTFEDAEGNEFGAFQTLNRMEAEAYGYENHLRVIANTLVFDDSELHADYTEETGLITHKQD